MSLTVYKQIKDKITFNLSSIQRSLCQLTVQKTDKSDRDQLERGQRRVGRVEREERRVQNAERGMWSVQSQRVSVTVKFWGRLDGLLNCFANSTVCSLQSLVFDCRSRVVLPFLQPLCFRFRFVFSMHVYVAVRLCLSLSLPPFLCLFYALPLPLFLPFALPLSFLFF